MTPLTPCLTSSYVLEIPPTLDPITQTSLLRSLVNSWNQGQFEYGSQCIQTESISPGSCQMFECLGKRKPGLRLESGRIFEIHEPVFYLLEKKRMSIYVH